MDGGREVPNLLAYEYHEAKKLLDKSQLLVYVIHTAAREKLGSGIQRVVRQRLAADGSGLELTVSMEDWGKGV